MMKLRCILTILLLVLLVAAMAEGKRKPKPKKGCELNKKVYKPGKTVYKDRDNCLKLKCVKEKKKGKGKKTQYMLRAKKYRNCQCFPALCRGPRCSPPVICPVCTEVWEPVCSTNNVTYSNECQFVGSTKPCGSDTGSIMFYGECGQCPVGCPKNMDPVCGSNGQTYDNECLMITEACETNTNITKKHDGECVVKLGEGADEECGKCPKVRKPVCGSNGVTYSNECVLEAAACKGENVTLAYTGECDSETASISQPVRKQCKYNGKKYNAGDIIEDMVDFCLTAVCQPSRKPGQSKVEFVDFQGAISCECTSDRLRRQILRISRE
ncbi:tomoregulin-1-like [Palaemon carinicauda]|uniref:tomoregulin-1-like n=1 Tax=Palaemon carinicauda TaxID=392227 RepID=UPI0035B68725